MTSIQKENIIDHLKIREKNRNRTYKKAILTILIFKVIGTVLCDGEKETPVEKIKKTNLFVGIIFSTFCSPRSNIACRKACASINNLLFAIRQLAQKFTTIQSQNGSTPQQHDNQTYSRPLLTANTKPNKPLNPNPPYIKTVGGVYIT